MVVQLSRDEVIKAIKSAKQGYGRLIFADAILAWLNLSDVVFPPETVFDGCDLRGTDFTDAELEGASLRNVRADSATFAGAQMRWANLNYGSFVDADFEGADLRCVSAIGANFQGAYFEGADMRGMNLSGAQGLLDPARWMAEHLEKTADGYIAHKILRRSGSTLTGLAFALPSHWHVEPGAVWEETVLRDPTVSCGSGVNVATADWVRQFAVDGCEVWKVLIPWEELPGVVIPYSSGGQFRVGRIKLLERMPR